MAVSIKDIARLAGVSHSTVSRALSGNPAIPGKTAERIRKIATEAGYRASAVARSLVTKRTHAIGLVVTSIADPFNAEVVAGVEDTANRHGYSLVLANSHAEPQREMSVVRSFGERRVDGVIVASSRVGALYDSLLANLGIPIVLLNNQHPSEFLHSVAIENVVGAKAATCHLIELGHRRIGYVGDESGLQSNAERLKGYREALRGARLEIDEGLEVLGDGKLEGGYRAAGVLLGSGQPPSAIVAYNDLSAAGVYKCAKERGLRVPEDLSITGFDDIFFAEMLSPPLTTVRQPKRLLGETAMELLLDVFLGNGGRRNIQLSGDLIVRGSTAPFALATNRSQLGRTRRPRPRSTA